MATRKKAKSKAKKAKKSKARKPVVKKKVTKKKKKVATRRTTAKKKVAKKKKPAAKKKTTAKKKPAVKKPLAPKPTPAMAKPVAPPVGEERIGIVTHYYTHLGVAIVQMETGSLRESDTIHIKGHTSDFRQRAESMEIEHVHVPLVSAGQVFGLRVKEHAREHDVVYKVA